MEILKSPPGWVLANRGPTHARLFLKDRQACDLWMPPPPPIILEKFKKKNPRPDNLGAGFVVTLGLRMAQQSHSIQ